MNAMPNETTTGGMLTIAQLADRLRVSRRTIHRWVANDGLPVHRFSARGLRYDPQEVAAWLRDREAKA